MSPDQISKTESLVRVGISYVLAFGAGAAWFAWGPETAWLWLDGLIANLIATLVLFAASRVHHNSSFYDPFWSVLPPLLMLSWWIESGTPANDPRSRLVMAVILFWAIRLTGNWIYAFPGLHHEDWRYPMLRDKAGKAEAVVDLIGIHIFPTVQVFLGMLPVYVVVTRPGRDLGWLDALAVLIGVGAVVLEFVADLQMHRFIRTRQPGQVMDQGLWSWSRHPNYFGELSFWLSLAVFGLAAAPDVWWVFVGAAAMYAMFQGASIPMMEQRSLERRPSYADVIARVPRFVPRPPHWLLRMTRPRVVIAGLGDSGLLTAIHLSRDADVVGISSRPGHVSGQELGIRLTRPHDWVRDYWISFDRYRRLDAVRTVHGTLTGVDLDEHIVRVAAADGTTTEEPYDVLVIATGVSNGFWRRPGLLSSEDVAADLETAHARLADAASIAIIGGGAAAVSSAINLATTWPKKRVDLYFPGERALPHHHRKVWSTLRGRLTDLGVGLHPGHRAVVTDGFDCDRITDDVIAWSTGQDPVSADAVLWTVGRVRPNTGWFPQALLDEHGFVDVESSLRLPGHPGVFAIGDVAATDPLRTSARNRADKLLARNIRAELKGKPLRDYKPRGRRWGSVVGVQANGLEVFAPNGRAYRFPAWTIRGILQGLVVRRGIYRGVRDS